MRAATLGATRGASLSASSSLSLASTTSDNTPPPGEIIIEFGTVFDGDWTPPATVIIRANSTEQVGNDAVIVVNGVADLSGTTIIIELAQTPEEDARIRLVQAVQVWDSNFFYLYVIYFVNNGY